ncbi:MAG: hypothetical protein RL641_861 [Candidatus Parcubacteria bacterium]
MRGIFFGQNSKLVGLYRGSCKIFNTVLLYASYVEENKESSGNQKGAIARQGQRFFAGANRYFD